MGMYPNMIHPIPFMKHKTKHQAAAPTQEKTEETTENKVEENKNVVTQEQPKEEIQQQTA